jgi:hypothetical protein
MPVSFGGYFGDVLLDVDIGKGRMILFFRRILKVFSWRIGIEDLRQILMTVTSRVNMLFQ